jgi:integrase
MKKRKAKRKSWVIERNSIRVKIREAMNKGKIRYQIEWYSEEGLQRASRSTKDEAERFADEVINSINAGDREATTFSGKDRKEYERCLARLEGTSYTLYPAVDQFVKYLEKIGDKGSINEAVAFYLKNCQDDHKTVNVTVPEAVELLLKEKQSEVGDRHMKDMRRVLLPFAETFKCLNLEDVTADDLHKYLEGLRIKRTTRGKGKKGKPLAPATRRNMLSKIHILFQWAKLEKQYLPDKMTAAEKFSLKRRKITKKEWRVPKPDKEIWTVKQAEKLMHGIREDLQPYAAILCFAGLRPSEARRLRWKDIDFGEEEKLPCIDVPAEITGKKNEVRYVPMSDNLRQWLEPHRGKPSALITMPNAEKILTKEAIDKLKLREYWPEDICRHSFASYRLKILDDRKEKLAGEMGNSPDVIDKHYKRPLKPEAGKAYFDIVPEA